MTKEEVLNYIRQNISSKSYQDMGDMLGLSAEAVRGRARRAGIKKNARKARTTASYKKELVELGSSFIVLGEFKGVGVPILHKCSHCGVSEPRRPQDVLLTPNCSRCSKKTKSCRPIETMLSNLPSQFSYVQGYQGYTKKCTFLCLKCSHSWEVQPTRLINAGVGCPNCKAMETAKRCRTSIDTVRDKCAELGLELVDEEYLGNKYQHTFRNLACGHTFKYAFNHLKNNTCRVCSEKLKRSAPEREVEAYIKSLGFDTSRGVLPDGKEIDILVDGTNIGIEFNGDFWHSEKAGKSSTYHLEKTELFDGKLIHLYNFMWEKNKPLIKSMLKHALGKTSHRIYARQTRIAKVPSKDARIFLDTNHIQGFLAGSFYYGLFYKNSLVAMMTFNKCRFGNKYEYEIGRYAVAQDTSVVGGASKLFKYFCKSQNPSSIVSYCHRFYSDGGLYKSLGMSLASTTRPGYWYLHPDGKTVSSRQKFQKHKLSGVLATFDQQKTEKQNMEDNGYSRIYDCGNWVFEWHHK